MIIKDVCLTIYFFFFLSIYNIEWVIFIKPFGTGSIHQFSGVIQDLITVHTKINCRYMRRDFSVLDKILNLGFSSIILKYDETNLMLPLEDMVHNDEIINDCQDFRN